MFPCYFLNENRRSIPTTLLKHRFRKCVFVELYSQNIWWVMSVEFCKNWVCSCSLYLVWEKSLSCFPEIIQSLVYPLASPFWSTELFSSTWDTHTLYQYAVQTIFDHHLDRPNTNLIFITLVLARIVRAYIEIWMNINVYCITLIFPFWTLKNLWSLTSLISMEKIINKRLFEILPIKRTHINFHSIYLTTLEKHPYVDKRKISPFPPV